MGAQGRLRRFMPVGTAIAALGGGCVKTPDRNGHGELASSGARDLGANLDFLQLKT
jgi:hypothetical protein